MRRRIVVCWFAALAGLVYVLINASGGLRAMAADQTGQSDSDALSPVINRETD